MTNAGQSFLRNELSTAAWGAEGGVTAQATFVGWLAEGWRPAVGSSAPAQGVIGPDLAARLARLYFRENDPAGGARNFERGIDYCPICGAKVFFAASGLTVPSNSDAEDVTARNRVMSQGTWDVLGHAELWLSEDGSDARYFVSPSLIIHYIANHGYLPPTAFCDRLLRLKG